MTEKNVDYVAAVSFRADGTPDQSEGFVVIGADDAPVEVAADVERPKSRKSRGAGKETR